MTKPTSIAPDLLNPKDLIIRHLIISAMSMFFGSLNSYTEGVVFFSLEWMRNVGFNFLYIATIWNGNIWIIGQTNKYIVWEKELKRFLFVIAAVAILWPIMVHYIFNLFIFPIIHGHPCAINSRENIIFLIISVTITLLVNTIFAAVGFFNFWRESIREQEELKREGMSAEFETLKSQINPHFLFNSLNTLTSLIDENPKTAGQFVQQLAGVYRYVLTQKDKELVPLREEMTFVKSYIYLNQIRFGENLHVQIQPDIDVQDKKIVTLSLQMLIENAIKHNVISAENPLTVTIHLVNNKIEVRNNLQRKKVMHDSHGIGLNNIVHRYGLIGKEEVEIIEDEGSFIVRLPLI